MPAAAAPGSTASATTTEKPQAATPEKVIPAAEAVRKTGLDFLAKRAIQQAQEARGVKPEKKPEEKKPDDEAKKEEPKAEEAKAPEEKPSEGKPKDEKPKEEAGFKRRQSSRQPDLKQVVETAATAAAKTAAETVRRSQEEPKIKRPEKLELPKEYERQREVFELLAEKHPERFGNKAERRIDDQLRDFSSAKSKYERDWKKNNPGQELDWEEDEHADWVAENYPAIEESDLEWAKEELVNRKIESKADEKVAPLRREMQVKEVAQRLVPQAEASGNELIRLAVKDVNPELVSFLTPDKLKDLAEEHPTFDRALREVTPLFYQKSIAAGVILADEGDLLYEKDNPVHKQVLLDAKMVEDHILKSGETTLVDGDRELEYVPMREWLEMTPRQRNGKWSVDASIMLGVYKGAFSKELKARFDDYEGLVTKRSGKADVSKNGQAKEKSVEKVTTEKLVETVQKGGTVTAGSGAATVGSGGGKATQMSDFQKMRMSRLFPGA